MPDDALDASTLPVDIILDIADHLAEYLIDEDDSTESSVASESLYLSAEFTIHADRDAERISNWISARKNNKINYLCLAIEDMRQYKSLCGKLSGISYDVLDLDFGVGMNDFALPHDIKVKRLALTTMESFTLKPSQLSKSVIESLVELTMRNVSFKKFESVNKSQYSFSKLKSFDLDCDGSSQQGLHTMNNILALMPALKEFSISCDKFVHDDEKCMAPLITFPASLNTVTSFICINVHADLSRCKWPNLEKLHLNKGYSLGQWTGLGDKLRVVRIYDSCIGEEHDICKPDTLKKLENLTVFVLYDILFSPVYRLFNDGFFDDAMPNLEELKVISEKTKAKPDAIMRFIERHPSLRSITVTDSEELSNMAPPSDVRMVTLKTRRERYLADDFDDLDVYDVYGDAFDSDDFDYGWMGDEYNEFDGGTDYDDYDDYDDM